MKRVLTRWKSRDAFKAIKNSRSIFRSLEFDIRVAPKAARFSRILVATPKHSGTAPERNLFRRRLKAIFQELQLSTGDYDWFFFARRNLFTLSYQALYERVVQFAKQYSSPSS